MKWRSCALMAHEVYAQMESLINPECEIPETSIAIHHITPEMVNGKPVIAELLPEILEMIGQHIIIGHGVRFDIDILAVAAERHGIPCKIRQNPYLDTLRMARLYGQSPINSLEHLRKHFNIPQEGAHRAMSDVIVNKEVFKRSRSDLKQPNSYSMPLSRPILMEACHLGNHKGRPFKDIPLQYLQWMST